MTKTIIYVMLFLTFLSCKTGTKENLTNSKSFIENIVDFVITNKDNNTIELPFVYNSLATQIPVDSNETLLLAESLKKRGFEVVNWGRGNYPPRGPRIITLTMQKEDCFCDVSKIYYSTTIDTLFEIAERISCKGSTTSIKK